jgi:hypothetical protein
LKFEEKLREENAYGEFYQGILDGNFIFTISASAQEAEIAKHRDELKPRQLILAGHTGAPATERFPSMQAKYYHIQKAADDEPQEKENKCDDRDHKF